MSRGLSLQSPHKSGDLGRERLIGCANVVDLGHVIVTAQLLHGRAAVVALAECLEQVDGLDLEAWRVVLGKTDEDWQDAGRDVLEGRSCGIQALILTIVSAPPI